MIRAFLKIRGKQFYRAILEIGGIRIIILAGLIAIAAFVLFIQTEKIQHAAIVSGVYLLVIAIIHLRRMDKVFLKSHFTHFKLIYLAEYSILTLPLIICLFTHLQWIVLASLFPFIGILINIDVKARQWNLNTRIQRVIPDACFEWKAGVRKTLFLLIALWVAGLGASFFIGTVPVVLFLFGVIPLAFYEKNESLSMVLAFEKGTNAFLFQKIKLQVLLYSVLAIPLMIAFIIFHSEIWYIPIVEYLIFISLHVYYILLKYAFYTPNESAGAAQVFGILGTMGTIFPIIIPVVWIMAIRFYFKSRHNLNFYLHDFN